MDFAESQVAKSLKNETAFKDKNISSLMQKMGVFSDSFVSKRKKEIELMLRSDYLSSASKEKLDLERRFLEILPIYKNVKDNVFGDLWRLMEKRELSNTDRTYYDRHFYKRPRPKRNQIVNLRF